MTLEHAVSLFMLSIEYEVKPPTLEWYSHMLAPLIAGLGHKPLTAVTPSDLRQWRKTVFDRDIADSSRNAYLRAAKRFFGWCLEERLLEVDPSARLKLLKLTNSEKKAADLADFQKILWKAREQRQWRNVAMILFLLGTGARVSAMVSLKIKHLDLVNGRAWVQKKSRELDARYFVYLDDILVEAIRDYFAYERRDNLRDDDYVFTNGRGQGDPLHRGSIWQILRKYGDDVGASGPVNPHSFRHAFAILRLQAGEDLVSLKDLMGHSDIKVTADSYGRYQSDQLRAAHQLYSPLNQIIQVDK